jgi:hypothetical protein
VAAQPGAPAESSATALAASSASPVGGVPSGLDALPPLLSETPPPPAPGTAAQAPGEAPSAAVASSSRGHHHDRHHHGASHAKGAPKLLASRTALPSHAPARSSAKLGDAELDALLESTGSAARLRGPAAVAAPEPRRRPAATASVVPVADKRPSGSEIQAAMRSAEPRANACLARFHAPGGSVNVHAVIGGDGRVVSSNVTGALSGTPTGDCVARAVRGASVRPFGGPPLAVNYAYLLH